MLEKQVTMQTMTAVSEEPLKFLNGELDEWDEIGFAFKALRTFTPAEVVELDRRLNHNLSGFILGNVDFALSLDLTEIGTIVPAGASSDLLCVLRYRQEIGK